MKSIKCILYMLIAVGLLLLSSCKQNESGGTAGKRTLAKSTGGVREIVAVVDDDIYTKPVEEAVTYFTGDMYAMPQPEPEMKVFCLPRSKFTHMYQIHRNMLAVRKTDSAPGIVFGRDHYASPQYYMEVSVANHIQLDSILAANRDKILDVYKNGDIAFLQGKLAANSLPASRTAFFEKFGAKITVPNYYRAGTVGENFIWLYKEVKKGMHKGTVNILLYKTKITDVVSPLVIRNEISKMYVGGFYEGSYQTVDFVNLPPREKTTELDGKFAFRSEGLWRMEGKDIMGGPFINYTLFDDANGTVWGADGFIFYPSQDKAQYIVELEAILRTFHVTE